MTRTYGTDEFGVPNAGLTQSTSGVGSQPLQYTGEPRDSTGLVYLRARMYDPQLGRFLQADPLRKSGPGVGGWNRYSYVRNNPLTFIDPTGQKSLALDDGLSFSNSYRLATTAGPGWDMAKQFAEWLARQVGRFAPSTISAGQTLHRGATGLATKADARAVLTKMNLPVGQATEVNRAIGRATSSSVIDIVRGGHGTVIVRLTRPGVDGRQVMVSVVTADGRKYVVQKAYDAAGNLVHFDPKTPPLD